MIGLICKIPHPHSYFICAQSIALVDEEVDAKIAKINERKKWTTQRGFQYPPPKKNKVTDLHGSMSTFLMCFVCFQDLIAHPKKPSEARIEDLHEPFELFDADEDRSDTIFNHLFVSCAIICSLFSVEVTLSCLNWRAISRIKPNPSPCLECWKPQNTVGHLN
jgi:hypothetical protein